MLLSEEIFGNFYEKGKSGGGSTLAKETTALTRDGVIIATGFGAGAWARLNERDEETGAPVGYLAIKQEQLTRRLQKMIAPRYGRRLQFA